MGMVVRTNVMAMNANRSLGTNNTQVGKSLEKLSSGFRINRAADDASGLAISEKMKAQIKGLEQASANSQDGISLIQTAEGATQEIHNMLNRMVELATKSANGTIQDTVDREAIQKEVDDLNSEITRIASSTNFNGIKLLNGDLAAGGAGGTGTTSKAPATCDQSGQQTFGTAGKVTFGAVTLEKSGASMTSAEVTNNTEFLTALTNTGVKVSSTASKTIVSMGDYVFKDGSTEYSGTGVAWDTASGAKALDVYEADGTTKVGTVTLTFGNAATGADGTGVTAKYSGGEAGTAASAGGAGAGLSLQVGDTNDAFNHVSVSVADLSAKGLGLVDESGNKIVDVSTQAGAGTAIDVIKAAINTVSTNRANLGSLQNRLEYTINNLDTTTENMTSANSRIRDTDMAKEMMNYTKMNILTQAAQAMLAQANQQPQAILQLLQ